jgi:post-segregation antitoxin (ccd killing protein)
VPKVSVYLPDDLYRRAREQGLKLSAITQAALERELADDPNAAWVERARTREPRTGQTVDTSRLLAEVRDEFGS